MRIIFQMLKFYGYIFLAIGIFYLYLLAFDPYDGRDAVKLGRFMLASSIFVFFAYKIFLQDDE
jgi:hypothetical protein